MDIKDTIKTMLDIDDDTKDKKIELMIDSHKQQIKNYLYRDDFPDELDHIVAEIIVEKTLHNKRVTNSGDISFEYTVSESTLEKYENQLQRFRKVRAL
ncbi:phage head-tail connector protein [Salsuginibacillus kocurii]|uniref:phage head-tail connector protein n=1 Tax=Salsuginibacillus kocurii TaxID=427078 RepID=UPI00037ADA20|nr:phage head-tail connector protein [Salsuginibacillus kocurii]